LLPLIPEVRYTTPTILHIPKGPHHAPHPTPPPRPPPPKPPHADILNYSVTGNIDTSDFLIITGDTLQWHHAGTGGAAVGRHSGNNFPTVITTSVNGSPDMLDTDWTPTWPDPVPAEIRFNAVSSIFDTLSPALPAADNLSIRVAVAGGRGSVSINQLPTAANDYTLIVEFKDGFNGSANLNAIIQITTTPEPASLTLLTAGSLLLLRRRRPPASHR
jgi:hypothetical protein